jgi:hypothetical protein
MSPVLTALGSSDFAGPYGLRASGSFVLERRSFVDRPRSELLWRSILGVPLPVSSIPRIMHKNKMTMSFIASLPRYLTSHDPHSRAESPCSACESVSSPDG